MNTPMSATHVFYSRSQNSIIDTCQDTTPPKSHINNQTLDEIRQRYPDAQYIEWEKASQMMDDANRLPVSETTEDEYLYMLEVLPPMDWKFGDDCESFKMCERYSGTITSIYARIGKRYFTLRDSEFLKHTEIVKRCKKYAADH